MLTTAAITLGLLVAMVCILAVYGQHHESCRPADAELDDKIRDWGVRQGLVRAWRDCQDCTHLNEWGEQRCRNCFDDPSRPGWAQPGKCAWCGRIIPTIMDGSEGICEDCYHEQLAKFRARRQQQLSATGPAPGRARGGPAADNDVPSRTKIGAASLPGVHLDAAPIPSREHGDGQ